MQMFLEVIESNLELRLVYRSRLQTDEMLRNILSPLQDSPSPTCLLDDSDSELSFPKKQKKESKDYVGEMRN